MHVLVVGQQLLTPAFAPDEELSVHEVMPTHLVAAQQRIELGGIWLSIRQETDPHRRVDQDDHAAECLADDARSRRFFDTVGQEYRPEGCSTAVGRRFE
jgi:hypothetical protein